MTRDRSTEYARGASQGAPLAIQVADRWHLLGNFREAFERLWDRLRPQLVAYSALGEAPITIYERSRRRGTLDRAQQQASRARRYERYAQVKALHAHGLNMLQIAKRLHLSRQTVRKYIASETFPDIQRSKRQRSILDPYAAYLQARWDEGCHDSRQLWRAIREQGYPGSLRMVWLWVALRREPEPKGRPPARQVQPFQPSVAEPAAAAKSTLPASRRLVWVFIHPPDKLDEAPLRLRRTLRRIPEVERAFTLTQRFFSLVRQRQSALLQPWIDDCRASGLPELTSFADGLQREFPIIYAALELPYSNGVTEGHVNRLKFLKRQMYGRANFDLLRRRVLASA